MLFILTSLTAILNESYHPPIPSDTLVWITDAVDTSSFAWASFEIPTFSKACPSDMALVENACMDLYEAPNVKGADPLVMQSAEDGEAWCADRGKRLCTEDEWTTACEGPKKWAFPYGNDYQLHACVDDKPYVGVSERLLSFWPGKEADQETARVFQAEPSGNRSSCVSSYGVYDLIGNVEEWARRRHPKGSYTHVLKGRFWAIPGETGYTCQQKITVHAARWRYYETGFRCCQDPQMTLNVQ